MTLRKAALLVGIDDYSNGPLAGCVNDVKAMEALLARNEDGSANFHCQTLVAPRGTAHAPGIVTMASLRGAVADILKKHVDMVLIYFSGHGTVTPRGGILVTQDATRNNEGVTMAEIVEAASDSKIKQVTIIVDACFAGQMGGAAAIKDDRAVIGEGVSILAASSGDETAMEKRDEATLVRRGVFTSLVCGALDGGAADVMGEVTAASIYAYAEQALGPLDQRPMFKANVERLSPLRTCKPVVAPDILRKIVEYFPKPDQAHALDPSYEPDRKQHPAGTVPDPAKEAIFDHLQKLRAARIVVPVDEDHMFFAAIKSKACKLTPLGQFYWKRIKDGLL